MAQKEEQCLSASEVVLRKMNEYRKTNALCDVEIIGESDKYSAHKAVLASFSKYFETLFLGQFVEAGQCSIRMPSVIESSIEEPILNFAYTYSIELSDSNVEDVFSAASFLQAERLIEYCCQFLGETLCLENCFHIAELAEKHFSTTLIEKSKEFCLENFGAISEEYQFLVLSSGNILMRLISEKFINIESDELVSKAVTRWVKHNPLDRSKFLPKLLAAIPDDAVVPVILLFGYCSQTGEENVRCYSGRGKLMAVLPGPPIKREKRSSEDFCKRSFCATSADYRMLLAGFKEKIWRFDIKKSSWIELPRMRVPRSGFALAELGGYWYAIGGTPASNSAGGNNPQFSYTSSEELVERYDPVSNTWTSVANLKIPVSGSSAVSIQGKIYVLGGITDGGCHSDYLQCYDPDKDDWTELERSPRSFCDGQRSCVVDDHTFCHVSSGSFDLSFYDVTKNEWCLVSEQPGMYGWGPVAFNGNLFIGAFAVHSTNVILEFSLLEDTWRFLAMPRWFIIKGLCGPLLLKRPKSLSPYAEPMWQPLIG